MATALAIALLLWALFVAGAELWALLEPRARPWIERVLPPRRAALPALGEGPARVLLVRPCAGRDEDLAKNLASLADARRDGLSIACVFAVGDGDDPALAECERAAAALTERGVDARVRVTGATGPNHKVDQLARAMEGRDEPVVLVADSDVDLTGVDLAALVEPLRRGELAAQWAPVSERVGATCGDRASVAILSAGLHAFALLARLDPAGMVGKLFAVRSDALASTGGFGALVRHLGEDLELSRRLRAAGLSVRARPLGVFSSARGRTLRVVRDRFARWLLVVRAQRTALMATYPLLFFAPLLQSLCALALAPRAPRAALAVLAIAVSARWTVAAGGLRASGHRLTARGVLVDPWLGDVVLALAWLRALTLREVRWRAGVLRLDREGLLVPGGPSDERG